MGNKLREVFCDGLSKKQVETMIKNMTRWCKERDCITCASYIAVSPYLPGFVTDGPKCKRGGLADGTCDKYEYNPKIWHDIPWEKLRLEEGKEIMEEVKQERQAILEDAVACVCGQRQEDYGDPEDSFGVTSQFWEVYVRERCVSPGADVSFLPDDVANMMELLKMARSMRGYNRDNYIDRAGYAACAGEIAARREKKNALIGK